MKIAIVTSNTTSVGGVQNSTHLLSKIFRERGHSVTLFGVESLKNKPNENLELAVGEHFNRSNSKNPYDVVLCNGEFGYAVDHPKAINVFRGNYHGYAMSVKDLVPKDVTDERLKKAEMQRISAQGKYVVTVSEFAVKGLNDSGIEVDRIIRNCIDTTVFYPREIKIEEHAIFPSRSRYYEKGFDIIRRLALRGIKIKLFSDIGIDAQNIENHEFVDNSELAFEYNKSQLLLFPSRFEGGSLTTLEAMASGCPLITTPVGYGPEIRKEIPNFVAEDISEFLAKFVLITNERDKYSKQALEYFHTFHNPQKFRREWISLMEGM